MGNKVQKKMEGEMETGIIQGLIGIITRIIVLLEGEPAATWISVPALQLVSAHGRSGSGTLKL